jgi:hypothetical protein
MAEKEKKVAGIDGEFRTNSQEKQLNDIIVTTFSTVSGRKVLQYLRNITIERVAGPNISDIELRHREGMRFIVGLIETRMKEGEHERSRSTKQ